MKKKIAILIIVAAFVVGFVTGSIVAILTRTQGPQEPVVARGPRSSLEMAPLSIEAMEKIEDLKETLQKDPKNLSAWKRLGSLYSEFNQVREAIDAFRQYLAVKPQDPDVRTDLGILLQKWNDAEGAIEEFRKASEGSLKHAGSRYHLGVVLLDKGDIRGAMRAWEDYLRVEPEGKRADWVRGRLEQLKTAAK